MIIEDVDEVEILAGGRVDYAIGGASYGLLLDDDQELVVCQKPGGTLRLEVQPLRGVFVSS